MATTAEPLHHALPQWPAIMSLKTAARYMDRTYDVVWSMVKRMEIPAVRHGNRQFLRRVDIDAWAEKNWLDPALSLIQDLALQDHSCDDARCYQRSGSQLRDPKIMLCQLRESTRKRHSFDSINILRGINF